MGLILGGLRPVTVMNDLILWRPLLDVPKNAITQWLQNHHLTAIEDPTNRDVRFMRGRFRETIIPMITEHFGKEISGNLARLGNEAQKLQSYMDQQVADYMSAISIIPKGFLLDLSRKMPSSSFELLYLIRRFLEKAGLTLSTKRFKQPVNYFRITLLIAKSPLVNAIYLSIKSAYLYLSNKN